MSPLTRLIGALACASLLPLTLAVAAAAAPASSRTPARVAAPNDALWGAQWGVRAAGGAGLWRWGTGSRKTIVAVLDTGVDASHPDLRGALVAGWNAFAKSRDTHDDNGHGTLVAGVVAARANNRAGIAGYCPSCSIMPVKVLDASGQGPGAVIAAGIDWAVRHHATIVNMSITLDHSDSAVQAAIARAVARGVLVVAASGNVGGADAHYPAAYPGVISVGGVDAAGALYGWSTFGSWVTASMPGCNETTSAGGGYLDFCGSSSATAAMSGLVALAASDAPHVRSALRSLIARYRLAAVRRLAGGAFVRAAVGLDRGRRNG